MAARNPTRSGTLERMRALMFRLCHLIPSLALLALLPPACLAATPVYGYKVVAKYPHSTSSYTEGFFYLDGRFYEGTGMVGRSAVMAIDPATGKVAQRRDLPPPYFGEGIVDWGPNIYEWTWESHV